MRLQSHDRFASVGDFDPASGSLVEFELEHASKALLDSPLGGHYASLNGVQAILYRDGDLLRLILGDLSWRLDDGIELEWESSDGISTIRVRQGDAVVKSVDYNDGLIPGLAMEDDPTSFAEREDFDFGLFARDIFGDPERLAGIYPLPSA